MSLAEEILYVYIYQGNVILRTYPQNIIHIHQTDQGTGTENIFVTDGDTQTDPWDIHTDQVIPTQTDDSDLFITCYDHVQAQ